VFAGCLGTQPFERLPHVPRAEELLEQAFRKARQKAASIHVSAKGQRPRLAEEARVKAARGSISRRLRALLRETPRIERVHPFYLEVLDTVVGLDRFKKDMGAVKWALGRTESLQRSHLRRMRSIHRGYASVRRSYFGRLASVLKQIDPQLDELARARAVLRKLPDIDFSKACLLVCGPSNTGKSTLVKRISSGKPKIAAYPFTTKHVNVGHRDLGGRVIQIVDTPGLLDRPLSKRNPIEIRAIAALRHLGDLTVFLFDPSEACGIPIEMQMSIYRSVGELLGKDTRLLTAANKIDLSPKENLENLDRALKRQAIRISCLTGEGIDELLHAISKELEAMQTADEGILH